MSAHHATMSAYLNREGDAINFDLRGECRPLPPRLGQLKCTREAAGLTLPRCPGAVASTSRPVRALRTGRTRGRPWTGSRSTTGYNTAEYGIWAIADVHAKAQASGAGQDPLAEWLNYIELLPEFLADESDRTAEFIEMLLHSIARVQLSCQYIVAEFERVSTGSAWISEAHAGLLVPKRYSMTPTPALFIGPC